MKVTYDTRISKAFGVKEYIGPRVGIELEYENANIYNLDGKKEFLTRWKITEDPSLRGGGVEFISKPTAPHLVDAALEQVKLAMDITGAKATKRCGVHVHLNVTDMTFRGMWKLATYYTLLEPFIFKEFADGREDSHFCVPTWANTSLQQHMYKDASMLHRGINKVVGGSKAAFSPTEPGMVQFHSSSRHHALPLFLLGNAKYSAMNFTPLESFGTVEFRQHTATVDMRKVKRWCDFLISLRRESLKYIDAANVLDQFEADGFLTLCEDVDLYQSPDVNPDHLEDAVDAAYVIVGHPPTDHHELNWSIK